METEETRTDNIVFFFIVGADKSGKQTGWEKTNNNAEMTPQLS